MPPKNHKKITNSRHLRQVLSNVINRLLNDEIDPNVANSIATLANSMLRILKTEEIENRIKKLEDQKKSSDEEKSTKSYADIDEKIKAIKTGEYKNAGPRTAIKEARRKLITKGSRYFEADTEL